MGKRSTGPRRVEPGRKVLAHQLQERVKELATLHRLAQVVYGPEKPLQDLLQEAASILPGGWQYPEITAARIRANGLEAATAGFRETAWRMTESHAWQWSRADVDIVYLEDRGFGSADPFLPEERELLRRVAEMLGAFLVRLQAQQALRESQRSLRESEERYRLLFLGNPHPMWVYELGSLRFLAVNDAALDHYGYSRDEFLQMTIKDIRPPEDVPMLLRNAPPLGAEPYYAGRWRHLKKDGATIYVDITAKPLLWEGKPAEFVLALDVTEQHAAQFALAESEAKFRTLAETAPAAIYIHDGQRFLYMNPASERISGYSRKELMAMSPFALAHPEDRSMLLQRSATRLGGGAALDRYEFRIVARDGSVRWLDFSANSIEFGGKASVLGMAFDITQRKDMEAALRRSESTYRSLFEGSPLGIYTVTEEGRFLTVNPALVQMLGYDSEEEVLALDVAQDVYRDPAQRLVVKEHIAASVREIAAEWKRKDGSLVSVALSGRRLADDEGRTCYEVIAQNMTEQRRLEALFRQAQKMEAVGRLAGGVAHDFNNLLTVISGYAAVLGDMLPASDPSRRHAEEIGKAAQRAAGLTRQLLAFSRRQVLDPKVLDLGHLVQGMSRMLRRLIGEDIELALRLAPGLGRVHADPSQMEQVIMNLVVNARDAMPGGGRLTIECANAELDADYAALHPPLLPGSYVKLAVSDTGTGMDRQTMSHLFEPFFTTKGERGTGLGMATVYGIVKQSGGYIWPYSEPGQGATFKVYLPRTDAPEPAPAPAPALAEEAGSETVLLVEDDPALRELVRSFLEVSGYHVLEAGDVPRALAVAAAHRGPIHLLLSDVVLPGGRGTVIAENLQAACPGIRVLFMSGYTDDAIVDQGVLEPGVNFLQKPFTRDALRRKLREVLRQE